MKKKMITLELAGIIALSALMAWSIWKLLPESNELLKSGLSSTANASEAEGEKDNPGKNSDMPENETEKRLETALFAAGCFWGVEEEFVRVDGVADTDVGYSGGHVENPGYKLVCTGKTGHAETVQVRFDPEKVSYEKLLDVFWNLHDPTQVNRQGPDFGTQYRSAVFYLTEEQHKTALASKAALEAAKKFSRPIATEITKAGPFYRAEEYHQRYLAKNNLRGCHL